MFSQIWQRVVRGNYRAMRAVAQHHARYAITGQTYPGMIVENSMSVQGVLYCDVSQEDLDLLYAFEGADYRRATVNVLLKNSACLSVQTYLYVAKQRLSKMPWESELFQIQRFFDIYCNERPVD